MLVRVGKQFKSKNGRIELVEVCLMSSRQARTDNCLCWLELTVVTSYIFVSLRCK